MTRREFLRELLRAAQDGDGVRMVEIVVERGLETQVSTLVEMGTWILGIVAAAASARWAIHFVRGLAEDADPDHWAHRLGASAQRLARRIAAALPSGSDD